ncbi:MAG: hypothetical protein QXI22_00605 [Sulfolobales archaeon]
MHIEAVDEDKGYLRVKVESEDDLWLLSLLVEEGDVVASRTSRDVRIEGSEKRRIPMTLAVRVQGIEFQPFSGRLRIKGVIVEGPEEYGLRGSHHTLSIDVGMSVDIIKKEGRVDLKLVEKILKLSRRGRGLIVAVDHDEYAVALLQSQGLRYIREGYMQPPSKRDPRAYDAYEKSLSELVETIKRILEEYGVSIVAIGSPGAIAEEIARLIRNAMPRVKVITDSVSMGGRAGVEEMLRRGTISKILSEQAAIEAEEILRNYIETLSREPERVVVGLEMIHKAAGMNAVKKAAILESLLKGDRATREIVNEILALSIEKGYDVIIVPTESPAGERLRMMGGAIAILRYSLPSSFIENNN